jgi:hypothetical protein
MAIQNPPITDNSTLNNALLEIINESNRAERKLVDLIIAIDTATSFTDLQDKVDKLK